MITTFIDLDSPSFHSNDRNTVAGDGQRLVVWWAILVHDWPGSARFKQQRWNRWNRRSFLSMMSDEGVIISDSRMMMMMMMMMMMNGNSFRFSVWRFHWNWISSKGYQVSDAFRVLYLLKHCQGQMRVGDGLVPQSKDRFSSTTKKGPWWLGPGPSDFCWVKEAASKVVWPSGASAWAFEFRSYTNQEEIWWGFTLWKNSKDTKFQLEFN